MLAALLLALSPGHAYFSTLVMAEVLFAFVFLAVVALLVWWTIDAERASWVRLLTLGVATGCLTLVRVEAVFLPVAFAVLWKVALPGWRPALRYSAIFALGFVLALTPWTGAMRSASTSSCRCAMARKADSRTDSTATISIALTASARRARRSARRRDTWHAIRGSSCRWRSTSCAICIATTPTASSGCSTTTIRC